MTYTLTALKSGGNLFGGLVNDGNRNAMTGAIGSYFQSQDATASPVTSPATNMTTAGVTLIVPVNAVSFRINSTVTIQVGEDSTYSEGYLAPANADTHFDCARMANIYLKPSNATNTTYFQFTIV